MKKLLIQLDTDRLPSAFDRVVGYDAGADHVLAYGDVGLDDVEALAHGAIFTRGPGDLKNTAIFIGGADLDAGERILERVRKSFMGPLQVSAMLDSNGSNTTAIAAVVKLERAADGVEGKRIVIAAGTGPVGKRCAGVFAGRGADVVITSRDQETADQARASVERRFGVEIEAVVVRYPLDADSLASDADIVLAAGPPGIMLVEGPVWREGGGPRVLGDVNAVPPLGIEGVEVTDDGESRNDATVFGALGIGNFKMKLHKASIARLFESNDLVLDAEAIYELAQSL